jgi:hypothetical protein
LNKLVFVLLLFLIIASFTYAQEEVPNGFASIILGMSMGNAKKEISADGNFNYRGDQDLSILRRPNESLIECRGYDFVDRAFFQFKDDKLYSITILFNQEFLDHYTLYVTLSGKYGDPDSLNPEKSIWESDRNTLVLERPLQIKYLDKKIFEGIIGESVINKSLSELSLDQFLEQF